MHLASADGKAPALRARHHQVFLLCRCGKSGHRNGGRGRKRVCAGSRTAAIWNASSCVIRKRGHRVLRRDHAQRQNGCGDVSRKTRHAL